MNENQFLQLKTAIPGVRWPAIPGDVGARMLALQYQFANVEQLSPEAALRLQLKQAREVVYFAHKAIPFYRQRFGALKWEPQQLDSLEQWRDIPVLARAEVQEAGENLLAAQRPKKHGKINKIQTSGSTGMPITAYGTELSQLFWLAFTLRDHLWHERDFTAKFAAIRPERELQAGESVTRKDWGRSTNSSFHTGPACMLHSRTDVAGQVAWLLKQQPDYLLSLPSNLRALGEHLTASGQGLHRLREVRAYGEVCNSETRAYCEGAFGVPVTDIYSCQEAGYIALQCPHGDHYHVQAEGVLLEVLDDAGKVCEPGETGRVVLTTLQNFATPLIRYALGDHAEVGEPCAHKPGLPVLKKIQGRERNMLTLPDGRRHYPSFPAELWAHLQPIRQVQLIQTDRESIRVRMVAQRPLHNDEARELIAILQERFTYPFTIHIDYVEAIERSSSGKYEDFISHVIR